MYLKIFFRFVCQGHCNHSISTNKKNIGIYTAYWVFFFIKIGNIFFQAWLNWIMSIYVSYYDNWCVWIFVVSVWYFCSDINQYYLGDRVENEMAFEEKKQANADVARHVNMMLIDCSSFSCFFLTRKVKQNKTPWIRMKCFDRRMWVSLGLMRSPFSFFYIW